MAEPIGSDIWAAWLSEYADRLLLWARQQTGSETDAEDLLQEAVVEAWQQQGDGSPPPLGLVYAIIRHRAIDRARGDNRRRAREAAAGEPAADWFEADFSGGEDARAVQELLAQLPAEQREVLTMKIWGELTFREIATHLGVPQNTVASRYRYALEAVRQLLPQER
jgi:RNA polymerase sigma-70 factor (ECF subfamily)